MNKQFILDYSYHNHTTRCGHAKGSDEEYIIQALKSGFRVYGVSDHIFLPGVKQPRIRGDYSLLDEYLTSINTLKTRYMSEIQIYTAFEAEFLPDFISYYKDLLASHKVDYLVLGQHGYVENLHFKFYGNRYWELAEMLKRYTDDLVAGINSGLFAFVAHPDFFLSFYPIFDHNAMEATARIIAAAQKNNMPLEINLGGVRRGMHDYFVSKRYDYPVREFWVEVAKTDIPVLIGCDAHHPAELSNIPLDQVETLLGDLELNLINRLTF